MTKREFLTAGIVAGLGLKSVMAQSGRVATRKAETTKLFKAPDGFPNGLAATAQGLWIAEQKLSGPQAVSYGMPEPKSLTESAWLVDWKDGKLLKTVTTNSRNTSGMAVGGGYVWMVANAQPEGVFQVDMNSKQISHR